MPDPATAAVTALLTAVESRDLRRIEACLDPAATWQNVPHAPAVGRRAVLELLAPVVTWSQRVAWDVATIGATGEHVLVERLDRFWIDGVEYAVACNGVFTVDVGSGRVRAVRDYVDLGEWRARIAPVLADLERRAPVDVVARHLAAVGTGDPVAMAADYALDATLERNDAVYAGWAAIAGYFDTVPRRLAGTTLVFGEVADTGADTAAVPWSVERDGHVVAAGRDEFTVRAGRIVAHTVELAGRDF